MIATNYEIRFLTNALIVIILKQKSKMIRRYVAEVVTSEFVKLESQQSNYTVILPQLLSAILLA